VVTIEGTRGIIQIGGTKSIGVILIGGIQKTRTPIHQLKVNTRIEIGGGMASKTLPGKIKVTGIRANGCLWMLRITSKIELAKRLRN
jgi:hypothetical protein